MISFGGHMHITEQIQLRVGSLPPDKQQEVLDFVEFLQTRIKSDERPAVQPFKGMPVSYIDPTEPVALDDWEAAR
jgi:hypothetical protein